MESNVLSIVLLILFCLSVAGVLASAFFGKKLGWQSCLVVAVLSLCGWGLVTEGLRGGLDLKGGTSLLYEVDVSNSQNPTAAKQRTIDRLSKRVDPSGQAGLIWRLEQGDRIEIQMPDPGPEVAQRRAAYEQVRQAIEQANILPRELEMALAMEPQARAKRLDQLVRGVEGRKALLQQAAQAYDRWQKARIAFNGATDDQQRIELAQQVNRARQDYQQAFDRVLATNLDLERLGQILNYPTRPEKDKDGKPIANSSPRDKALKQMADNHPLRRADLEKLVAAYEQYAQVKGQLDDPNDLIRMLQGQGVLEFRIAVDPTKDAIDVAEQRKRLLSRGPGYSSDDQVVWMEVDEPTKFFDKPAQDIQAFLDALDRAESPQNRQEMLDRWFGPRTVGEVFGGRFYVLLWNTPDMSMTARQPGWAVAGVSPAVDDNFFPAVAFDLNPRGQYLMGQLTRPNVGRQMAVVLDGKVLTWPTIQEALGGRGVRITGGRGGFSRSDQEYLIRTLEAGSLDARLGDEPIAIRRIDAQFGADNLQKGLEAATIALICVAVFMAVYYFFAGLVAVAALLANVVVILGIMALYKAAFTLPGIAGVVLTIGMCVDANVLVFERIREELNEGKSLEAALRLGYSKAFSAILDGNLTNLIVCVILFWTATIEIRGFAVVLGIGIASTLFTSLFMSRVIFDIYNRFFSIPSLAMLPSTVPAIERAFYPNINWLAKRGIFFTLSGLAMIGSLALCISRGQELLDIEFRAGTEVAFNLKPDPQAAHGPDGRRPPMRLALTEARQRLKDAGAWFDPGFNPDRLDAEKRRLYDRAYPEIQRLLEQRRKAIVENLEQKLRKKQARQAARQEQSDGQPSDASTSPQQPPIDTAALEKQAQEMTDLRQLKDVTVVPVGHLDDQLRAPGFSVLCTVSDAKTMAGVVKILFADVLDIESSLSFKGIEHEQIEPVLGRYVFPIRKDNLGQVINRPAVDVPVGPFLGGVAIVLDDIHPSTTVQDITQRIKAMRLQPDYQDLQFRRRRVIGLSADPAQPSRYRSAVVLVHSEKITYDNPERWQNELARREWQLVRDAMRHDRSLAKVSNFTPDVARTLRDKAIVALLLSFIAIVAYIWFRFGNLRYGLAAIVALAHDVTIALGLIAFSPHLAGFMGIEPYKINLGLVAALLTIVGYSLNDTIVVFDRIRENRGKLARVTGAIINKSINQTLSRTLLTSGTTLLAVVVLYAFGSAGIREFAFALIVGVGVGTYSSIAIASPILTIGQPVPRTAEPAGKQETAETTAPAAKTA